MSDNKPVRIKLHPLTASIWRNQAQNGPFYTVQFSKSYRDTEGNWKHTDIFTSSELLLLSKLADLAETEVRKLRSQDRSEVQSEDNE
jgi:hypothetical protein